MTIFALFHKIDSYIPFFILLGQCWNTSAYQHINVILRKRASCLVNTQQLRWSFRCEYCVLEIKALLPLSWSKREWVIIYLCVGKKSYLSTKMSSSNLMKHQTKQEASKKQLARKPFVMNTLAYTSRRSPCKQPRLTSYYTCALRRTS